MKQYNAASSALREWWDSASSFCSKITLFSRLRLWQRPVVLPEKLTEKQSRTNGRSIVPFPKNMFSMTVFDAEKDADAIAEKVIFCLLCRQYG